VTAGTEPGQRLWRARRRHDHLDAIVRAAGGRWELQYLLNGRVMLAWRFDSPEAAAADAGERLSALQRAGWNIHW
jgi:hypothetical protein